MLTHAPRHLPVSLIFDVRQKEYGIMGITCAPSIIEIQRRNRLPCIIGALISVLGIVTFVMADMAYVAPLALLPAAIVIGKRTIEIHRHLSSCTCEGCHAPAGRYRTEGGRISLVCVSCGHISATDCGITHAGGSIHQIQKN